MEFTVADRPLQSWTILELLDRAFRIYRENFLTFVGVMAIVTIPFTVLNLFLSSIVAPVSRFGASDPRAASQAVSTVCLASLLLLFVSILQVVLTYGPLVYATGESVMGRKLSIGQAITERRERYFGLGLGFVLFYVVLGAFVTAISLVSVALRCSPAFAALGIVAYIGIAGFTMLPPVMMLENTRASAGVNRAWSLGKAGFWKNFGAMIAIGVITTVIQLAFGALAQWLIIQNLASSSYATLQFAQAAVNVFTSIFTLPLIPIVLTLLYFDARVRFEGLDIAMQTLDSPNPRPWSIAAPASQSGLGGKDWRNIAILVVGALVISLLFAGALSALVSSFAPMSGLNLPR